MEKIILRTWTGKDSLTLEGNSLYLDYLGKHSVIPISQIISFEIKEPKGKLRPGMVTVRLAGSSDTRIMLTSLLSVGGSNNIEFPHAYDYAAAAHQMQQRIASHSEPSSTTDNLDNLRKLKSLMDDGIITTEEYEAKKKQILGL